MEKILSPFGMKVVKVLGYDGDFIIVDDTPPRNRLWIHDPNLTPVFEEPDNIVWDAEGNPDEAALDDLRRRIAEDEAALKRMEHEGGKASA